MGEVHYTFDKLVYSPISQLGGYTARQSVNQFTWSRSVNCQLTLDKVSFLSSLIVGRLISISGPVGQKVFSVSQPIIEWSDGPTVAPTDSQSVSQIVVSQ